MSIKYVFNPTTGNLDATDKVAFNGEVNAGSAASPSIFFTGDPNTGIYSPGADQLALSTNGTGRVFIDASGRILVGTSSAVANATLYNTAVTPLAQVHSTGSNPLSVTTWAGSNATSGGIVLSKSRGASVGTRASVINNDDLGNITFTGDDNANFIPAASILCEVDAAPASNSMPGRLVLATTADGAASPTERLRITSAGLVGIGTSSPSSTNGGLDIASGGLSLVLGADGSASTRTNVTNKQARIGAYHYTNAEEPVGVATVFSTASSNAIYFGGGTASVNAATSLEFYTAANTTTTTGTQRMVIDSSGRVGIGTTSPQANIHCSGSIPVVAVSHDNTGSGGFTGVLRLVSANGANFIQSGSSFTPGSAAPLSFTNMSNGTEWGRWDSSGRFLVGTSSARSNFSYAFGNGPTQLQVEAAGAALPVISAVQNYDSGTTGAPAYLVLARAGSTAIGSNTVVANGNWLGEIDFSGSNGTNFIRAASIRGDVDTGTVSSTSMPGRLVFSTTSDGQASPSPRLTITSTGQVRLAGAGITFNGDTATANELDDYEEGTWTPTIAGQTTTGTGTYSVQSGRYTKVGRSVYVAGTVAWSAHDGTGNMRITGLPFTALNVTELANAVSFAYVSDITIPANSIPIGGVFPNSTFVTLYSMAVAGGTPNGLGMDGSGTIYFSLTYQTA